MLIYIEKWCHFLPHKGMPKIICAYTDLYKHVSYGQWYLVVPLLGNQLKPNPIPGTSEGYP